MSDTSQGAGWWLASDGKWYPPQAAPGYQQSTATLPPPGGRPPSSTPRKKRHVLRCVLIAAAVVVVLAIIGAAAGSKDDKKDTVSAGTSPGSTAAATTATTGAAATTAPVATSTPTAATPATAAPATAAPTTAKASDLYQVGETATTGDLEVTVNGATDPYPSTSEYFKPDAGNRWVAVDLTVKNDGSEKVTFSTLALMELKDSESKVWGVSLMGAASDPNHPQVDGDIVPGDSRRGTVVFELPESATGLTLRVKGGFTANGAVWQLP